VSYWAFDPVAAPTRFADALGRLRSAGAAAAPSFAGGVEFNTDDLGLPQNEEAVDVCGTTVIGGTNDYRGLAFGNNLGGWELSTNGGASVTKDGLLPGVTIAATPTPWVETRPRGSTRGAGFRSSEAAPQSTSRTTSSTASPSPRASR
jgi:hypothetical protein